VASQWYCLTDDEEGPFTFQELAQRLAQGELLASDLVRRQESSDWQRADAVFGLMRAARQISPQSRSPSAPAMGILGRWLLRCCERLFPDFPPERLLAGVSLLFLLIMAGEVLWIWSQRPTRFPAPPARGVVLQGPDRLQQLRPPAPAVPTLPQLAPGVPIIVPGFEQLHWLKSPALSADLLTIVYIGYAGADQLDDLMIAQRTQVHEPFRHHRPISQLNSPLREAHPALSPDGKELIFSRLAEPTSLWIARRDDRDSPFAPPRQLELRNDPQQDRHHDAAHYLGPQMLCVTVSDVEFKDRQPWLVTRTSTGAFQRTSPLSLINPWPRYFFTAGGKRAFLPTPDGLQVTARSRRNSLFEDPELLFGPDVVGPDLTANDDTLWVAPAEDVLFYCGPGPQPVSTGTRRLWMIRLSGMMK